MVASGPAALLALLVLAPAGLAQGGGPAAGRRPSAGSARERWQQMKPEERARMLERFEELKRRDQEERRELEQRGRALERIKEGFLEQLGEEEREALEGMDASQRRAWLHERLRAESQERGQRIRELLPRDLIERLESAKSPRERLHIQNEFLQKLRNERGQNWLRFLADELDLTDEEVERIQKLPPEQALKVMLQLERQSIRRWVEREGRPSLLSEQDWKRLETLDDRGFHQRWNRMRGQLPGQGRRLRGLFAPGRLPPTPEGEALRAELELLHQAIRPDPAVAREWADLAPAERRRRMGEELRRQVLPVARTLDWVSSEDLARLEAVPGENVEEALARAIRGRVEQVRARSGEPFPEPRLERLRRALDPDEAWREELKGLPPGKRRAIITARIKERMLPQLESAGWLPQQELDRLTRLEGEEFVAAARDLIEEHAREMKTRRERPGGGRRQGEGREPGEERTHPRADRPGGRPRGPGG